MIPDLIKCLFSRIDWSDLSITFPSVLEQMTTSDCNFEVTASNSIQKAKLFFSHNVATHTLSLTIHNRGPLMKDGWIRTDHNMRDILLTETSQEEVLAAVETMKTVFGISDVKTVTDGSKA